MRYPAAVDYFEIVKTAFYQELEKIGAAYGTWAVPQARKGVRPMRVATLLRKELDGTLKKHAVADISAISESDDPNAARLPEKPGTIPSRESGGADHVQALMDQARLANKSGLDLFMTKKNKLPTRDENDPGIRKEDGRDSAATVLGLGTTLNNNAPLNTPIDQNRGS